MKDFMLAVTLVATLTLTSQMLGIQYLTNFVLLALLINNLRTLHVLIVASSYSIGQTMKRMVDSSSCLHSVIINNNHHRQL